MSDASLRRPLLRRHRAFARALLLRHVLRASAVCALAIALAVTVGVAWPFGVAVSWLRLAIVTACGLVAALAAARAVRAASLTFDGWLEHAEARFPVMRSWLRNALELEHAPAPGTSPELAAAVVREGERRLADVPIGTLAPRVAPRLPAIAALGALLLIVGLGAAWPERTARSWSTLWSPATAAPPVRLVVEPGSVTVSPGAALAVHARVWGSDQAPRLAIGGLRAPEPVAESAEPGGARRWRFDLVQLSRETDYRVKVATVESPRYRIAIGGDPAPVGFRIEYRTPAYARLPVQSGAAARGDLSALRGTRAAVEVTFDRDLDALEARLPDGRTGRWTALTPRRWRGEMTIDREGEYELAARGAGTGATARHRYRITPLADAPPVIAVRVPERDVDLPAGQQVPFDVLAQDDLGLSELKLQVRKQTDEPWREVPLANFDARPREAAVAALWDAAPVALLPGEVATFRFVAFDDNAISGRGSAVSPMFELRFPTLGDLYERLDDRQGQAQTALEKAAEQARELQKQLDKLARQAPRTNAPSPQSQAQSQARAEEMKSAFENQQQISQQVQEAAKSLQQTLEQAAERRAFDEQLMRKLQELQELMKQVQNEDFREAMKRMQEALAKQDMQKLETTLPRMRQEHPEMLKNLERTIELLKKLREEEKLQSLARRAEELKQQQDALNREYEQPAPRSAEDRAKENQALAEAQEQQAREAEQLAQEAAEASKEQETSEPTKQAMEEAAEAMKNEAAPEQREASEATRQNQRPSAQKSGSKASEALQRAADRLQAASEQLQNQEQDLDLAALRRAAQDLVSLQRSADRSLNSDAPPSQKGDEMTDLAEGTERVADSLAQLAGRTPMLSPQLGESLGRAIRGLRQAGREMGSGQTGRAGEAGKQGSRALNEAVLELRDSEASMCNQPGSGPPDSRKKGNQQQKLGELGERQSQLNRQTRNVAQRLSEQMRMSAGDEAEMRRLSEEQARIREMLESVQREEEREKKLLGRLDEAKKEMEQVEEALAEGSSPGDLEEKQTRILSRLLDAQRSINRRDFEPERESRTGEDVSRPSPGAIPQELLRQDDRLRLDMLKAGSDRYPAQYRAFIEEYLRRLNGGGTR